LPTAFRFRAVATTLRDDTNGVDEREVTLGEGNLLLLSERELAPGMVSIPLARIVRDGRGGLLYDSDYMAPTLRMAASQPLMLLAKRLLETLAEKMAPLTRSTQKRVRFEAGTGALDVASYWFLHALSSAAPVLRHLYGWPVRSAPLPLPVPSMTCPAMTIATPAPPSGHSTPTSAATWRSWFPAIRLRSSSVLAHLTSRRQTWLTNAACAVRAGSSASGPTSARRTWSTACRV
jgi:hypothetical protein